MRGQGLENGIVWCEDFGAGDEVELLLLLLLLFGGL